MTAHRKEEISSRGKRYLVFERDLPYGVACLKAALLRKDFHTRVIPATRGHTKPDFLEPYWIVAIRRKDGRRADSRESLRREAHEALETRTRSATTGRLYPTSQGGSSG